MNRMMVARELVTIAESLVAIDFPTKDAMDKYLKKHPDADRSNHKVVETKAPAQKAPVQKAPVKPSKGPSKSEHTHSFGKMSEGDSDDTKVRVYDNGGKSADRYSVVVEGKDWESSASPGYVPMLSLSEGGRGVSQFGEGKEGGHLGKPVKWDNLDSDTRKHIEERLRSSGQ